MESYRIRIKDFAPFKGLFRYIERNVEHLSPIETNSIIEGVRMFKSKPYRQVGIRAHLIALYNGTIPIGIVILAKGLESLFN